MQILFLLDATANQQKIVPQKYKQETPAIEPEKALKDLLDKIKRDDVISQYDEMEKALKGFSNAKSKQDIRKTIDEASVENFAKEIVYDIGNKEKNRERIRVRHKTTNTSTWKNHAKKSKNQRKRRTMIFIWFSHTQYWEISGVCTHMRWKDI